MNLVEFGVSFIALSFFVLDCRFQPNWFLLRSKELNLVNALSIDDY